jgi:hypothetical protein
MSYYIGYNIQIDHDDQALDIMNIVNQALHDAALKAQFVISEDLKDDDPFLLYSLVETEELEQE